MSLPPPPPPPPPPPYGSAVISSLSLFSQIRIREQEEGGGGGRGPGGAQQQKARGEVGGERKLKQYGKEIRKVGGLGCLGNCGLPCAWVGVLMTPPNYGKIRQATGNGVVRRMEKKRSQGIRKKEIGRSK